MRISIRRLALIAALAAAALGAPAPTRAQDRALAWDRFEVEARLAADGALDVLERHAIVFTGDWNGGERSFRVAPGQAIEIVRMTRIDPATGASRDVPRGDLAQLDRYDWTDSSTLRWRSRMPSDPPFDQELIVYEIEYRETGVLKPLGDDLYRLDHDFGMPDLPWPIAAFRLDLEIDPAFEPIDDLPAEIERPGLSYGENVVVTGRLRYLPSGSPAAAIAGATPFAVRAALFLALILSLAWLLGRFRREEKALGRRWRKIPAPEGVDRAWLEQHLLGRRPEVVGAFWDRLVGPPEVAALIARWVAEGRVSSTVEPATSRWRGKDEMRLRLLADRETFTGYERALLDKLFYSGRHEVTTAKLRKHYEQSGFDPAGTIRSELEERVKKEVHASRAERPAPARRPTLLLFLVVAALVALEAVTRPAAAQLVLVAMIFLVPAPYGIAAGIAYRSRREIERLGGWAVAFCVPLAVTLLGALFVAFGPELMRVPPGVPPGIAGVLALALATFTVWRSVTNVAASREGEAAIAARRELLTARHYLENELERERPDLEDAWFPYLLAFGLSDAVDRWTESFGPRAAASGAGSTFSGSSGSGSSGGGWTGGGGNFGGAGASGVWAAAATGMAAGVAAPSSSGSSGGGGGGGGSSGGGGGGGW